MHVADNTSMPTRRNWAKICRISFLYRPFLFLFNYNLLCWTFFWCESFVFPKLCCFDFFVLRHPWVLQVLAARIRQIFLAKIIFFHKKWCGSNKVANSKNISRPNKEIKYISRTLTEFKDFSRWLHSFFL